MRIIDQPTLVEALQKTSLKVASVSFADTVAGEQRATFCSYFGKYLKVQWLEEPAAKQSETLKKILAAQLDIQSESLVLVDHPGSLPEPAPPHDDQIVKFELVTFPKPVSKRIEDLLTAALVAGAEMKRYQSAPGVIFEVAECPDAAKKELIRALDEEDALAPCRRDHVPVFGYTRESTICLDSHQIAEFLLTEALRFRSPNQAVKLFNAYLSAEKVATQQVIAIDGIQIEKEVQLLPGVKLVPTSGVQHFGKWKEHFNISSHRFHEERRPTGALCIEREAPAFVRPGQDGPKPEIDTDRCLKLLPLFGPSGAAPIIGFMTAQVSLESRTGGHGIMNYPRDYTPIPFMPDFTGFENLYHKFGELQGTCETRVGIALDRLLKCFRTWPNNLTDRCLDLGIALESILLSGKDDGKNSGEITYRLASRGAWFLGETPEERYRIFGILKSAYGLRSSAAHDGKVGTVTKTVHKGEAPIPTIYLLQDAADLCCQVVRRIIENGDVPNWHQTILGFDEKSEGENSETETG